MGSIRLFLSKTCYISNTITTKSSYSTRIWFGWVLWHINHCRLFNTKSSLHIYIKYKRFGLVGFHGTSTIAGYLMLNFLYIHIYQIYRIWFVWVSWHINHCRLSDAKFSLYIYIKYMGFGLVGFHGTSDIVAYLRSYPVFTDIYQIYDL